MLCAKCISIFHNFDLEGAHHESLEHLERAAGLGCRICLHLAGARAKRGPDEANENIVPLLRYTLRLWQGREVYWILSFAKSAPRWAHVSRTPGQLELYIHVCEGPEPPSNYSSLVDSAAQAIPLQPWAVFDMTGRVRTLPRSSGDEKVAAVASSWLQQCTMEHARCSAASRHRPAFCPRRLLAVQAGTSSSRLVLREELMGSLPVKYCTLSHCWGPMPSFLTLTGHNLESFQETIEDNSLPKSFTDAIITVRRLGFAYIWIDSLCIIQSGDGSRADWLQNSSEMASIYSNAELNLSIDHAASPKDGAFVTRNPEFFEHCHTWSPVLFSTCPRRPYVNNPQTDIREGAEWFFRRNKAEVQHDRVLRMSTVFVEADDYTSWANLPLTKRAWVMQERLMSPRVLHFTADRIGWECSEKRWLSEYLPAGMPCGRRCFEARGSDSTFNVAEEIKSCLVGEDRGTARPKHLLARSWWEGMVWKYSKCQLSHPSQDKLVAFSAVARLWADAFVGRYYAGIFGENLPAGLLWLPKIGHWRTPSQEYRAPSWSWASIDGEISCFSHNFGPQVIDLVDIKDIGVELADEENPFGQVTGAGMTLTGFLVPFFENEDLAADVPESPEGLDDESREVLSEGRSLRSAALDREVWFMFDDPLFQPSAQGRIWFLPIQAQPLERIYGLMVVEKSSGTFARVGYWNAVKPGARDYLSDPSQRVEIVLV